MRVRRRVTIIRVKINRKYQHDYGAGSFIFQSVVKTPPKERTSSGHGPGPLRIEYAIAAHTNCGGAVA
jgi:hypothetical protein